jgi:hypothetical protein
MTSFRRDLHPQDTAPMLGAQIENAPSAFELEAFSTNIPSKNGTPRGRDGASRNKGFEDQPLWRR